MVTESCGRSGPVRVMIVDDHPLMRRGMRCAVDRGEDVCVVAEAGSLSGLFGELVGVSPDVILLDVRLPDGDGIDHIKDVRERCPNAKVIVVTAAPGDKGVVRRAMTSGAAGFLSKSVSSAEMIDAIRGAHEGLTPFTGDVTALLLDAPAAERDPGLTARELQTLALLSDGLSNASIARRLYISECTVKFHVRHVFEKLGVRNRVEAASWYRRRDVV